MQTLQDSNPEVAKLYEFALVAAGEASINTSAADVQIIIPASDNVHGVISFSSLSTSVSEDVGNLDITVSRGGGLVGDLLVNFTVEDRTAIAPNDYQINNSCKYFHQFIYLFNLSVHPSIHLFIHSFIYPSIHSSIHPSIHLSIHSFIPLFSLQMSLYLMVRTQPQSRQPLLMILHQNLMNFLLSH